MPGVVGLRWIGGVYGNTVAGWESRPQRVCDGGCFGMTLAPVVLDGSGLVRLDDDIVLGEKIGGGKYATVYEAESKLYGACALKQYPCAGERDVVSAEFEAEVAAHSALGDSPHWASYFAAGLLLGKPSVVQERIRPLPFLESVSTVNRDLLGGDVLEFCALALDALDALHAAGWAHGDCHCGNLLLCYDESLGRARVRMIDFNRAKVNAFGENALGGKALGDVNTLLCELAWMTEEEEWYRVSELLGSKVLTGRGWVAGYASSVAKEIRSAAAGFECVGLDEFAGDCYRGGWFGEHASLMN